jgi:hypothetical protein
MYKLGHTLHVIHFYSFFRIICCTVLQVLHIRGEWEGGDEAISEISNCLPATQIG